MSNLKEISMIKDIYDHFDWFKSVNVLDDKIIIYVDFMNQDVFNKIPDTFNGKNVKIHFYQSRMCSSDMYIKNYNFDSLSKDFELFEFVQSNTKIYGRRVMASMFYEVHDGDNSTTNLKIKYPHLYIEMERFYNQHGYLNLARELAPYGIVQ